MSQTTDGCLGATFLEQFFMSNLEREEADGSRPTPVCIWGTHGIGKTEIALNFARQRGWKIAYCAPAQFEEMGDLHGMPYKIDPDPTVHGDERTVYMPPDWVPKDEGPGLLILDDINRADDRILRGVMQLLQHFEMFSWSIPKKWQIIATANPDTGAAEKNTELFEKLKNTEWTWDKSDGNEGSGGVCILSAIYSKPEVFEANLGSYPASECECAVAAAENGRHDNLDVLSRKGYDLSKYPMDSSNGTLADIAALFEQQETVEWLISQGVNRDF